VSMCVSTRGGVVVVVVVVRGSDAVRIDCSESFYGDDQLYQHMHKQHETCHLCVKEGVPNAASQFYHNYEALEVRHTCRVEVRDNRYFRFTLRRITTLAMTTRVARKDSLCSQVTLHW
jgi:hypothetical protein